MALFRNHGMHVFFVMFFFLFVNTVSCARIQTPDGFSVTMIPRYSRNAPGCPGNLTEEERYALMLQSSHIRAKNLASMVSTSALSKNGTTRYGTHLDSVSPVVSQLLDSHYIVQMGIGTPVTPFFLLLDTGSSETWVQTKYCTVCFPYKHDPYDFDRSSTYQWMHCDHPNCQHTRCVNDLCIYDFHYEDKSISLGFRALETFTMYSADTKSDVAIRNLVFGCGLKNFVKWGKNSGPGNEIAGVFGMGRGQWSFISQLNMAGEGRRFSYCLTHWTTPNGGQSPLKFGSSANIPQGAPVNTTPLVNGRVQDYYYVNLLNISVDGVYLNFPQHLFQLRNDGTGGMIVDTGSALTYLYTPAFNALVERIMEIFTRAGLRPTPVTSPRWSDLQFCWTMKTGVPYPKIVFHFDGGASFEPYPDAIFVINGVGDSLCLQIFPTDELAILGAFTMTNHIFQHDIVGRTLSFAKQDCTHF